MTVRHAANAHGSQIVHPTEGSPFRAGSLTVFSRALTPSRILCRNASGGVTCGSDFATASRETRSASTVACSINLERRREARMRSIALFRVMVTAQLAGLPSSGS